MLLGIPGDNTFSNYQEANRTFWRQTVLPLAQRTTAALGEWLAPAYSENLSLTIDLDEIPALSSELDTLWTRIGAATFLADVEKRAAVGYGPSGEGAKDFNPDQPRDDQGRWSSDGGDPGSDAPPTPIIGDNTEQPQDVAGKPKSTSDILLPGGNEVGVKDKGAGGDIRTVSASDFQSIKDQLLEGSVALPQDKGYSGTWYQRADGTVFGIRGSASYGETIDIRSSNIPLIGPGYKVHYK
jgi:hypothetical protein